MLIRTISFDIPNLRDNSTESFLIPDTIENQEFVFTHKRTRNIRFGKTFDFQLEKDMRMPVEMISDAVWLALLPEMEKEMSEYIEETQIDIAIDNNRAEIASDINSGDCECEHEYCNHTQLNENCLNHADNSIPFIGKLCGECRNNYLDTM